MIPTCPTPLLPHEVDHLCLSLVNALRAEEDSLHQRDDMLGGPKAEDVDPPHVGEEEQQVWEDEAGEEVLSAVYDEGALAVLGAIDLHRL